jgi:hypothetical protein
MIYIYRTNLTSQPKGIFFRKWSYNVVSSLGLQPETVIRVREGAKGISHPWFFDTVRCLRVEGKERMGVEKPAPNVRWVREGGRGSTWWLKQVPNVRWVRDLGRESTGILKLKPNVRCVREWGR